MCSAAELLSLSSLPSSLPPSLPLSLPRVTGRKEISLIVLLTEVLLFGMQTSPWHCAAPCLFVLFFLLLSAGALQIRELSVCKCRAVVSGAQGRQEL